MILTSFFVWVSCFLLFLFLRNRQKVTFNLFLTATVFSIILALISQRSNHLSKKVYAIIMKKTTLLSNISESKEKQVISSGNKVEIIKSKKDIFLVVIPNGEIGWVSQSDIEEL